MKFIKEVFEIIGLLLGAKSNKAVDDGLCDYSGQGRDRYGR